MGRIVTGALAVLVVLALPGVGLAQQEAAVSGTVADTTGAVLPGATVIAVNEATGNTFETVTNERGAYRIPVRVGGYRVTAALPGFQTVTRTGVEVLVGQTVVVNMTVAVSAIQETVTVTAEAPLVDTTSSQLGGNIDPRQMAELPLRGRNYLDLALLAPGARANHSNTGGNPTAAGIGTFQLNVDGQQVTGNCCGDGRQPTFSRDAIAEFVFLSSRFDAVQGRSAGIQVNVITKSGTNSTSGTFSGYFRDDKMNAADFIQQRVLPYSNQQLSATVGGPIIQDRFHYFGVYEFEREPATITHDSPWPSFNIDLASNRKIHKAATRADVQFSSQTRLSLTGNLSADLMPIDPTLTGGGSRHPSQAVRQNRYSQAAQASLTHVLSARAVNTVRGGWSANSWIIEPVINWTPTTGLGLARSPVSTYPPNIDLTGYQIGPQQNYPQHIGQDVYSVRDDFTLSYEAGGRHDLRTGGEYLKYLMWHDWCNFLNGNLAADRVPVPANIEQLFPVWNDPNTWNIAALSPIARNFQTAVGSCNIHSPRNVFGVWAQDDWRVNDRLTLNVGVRYDAETDVFANDLEILPFVQGGRPDDLNNVAPRLGFAYSLNDRTVVRGGWGKYYEQLINQAAHPIRFAFQQRVPEALNDGRPDFAVNPWNGALPPFEALEGRYCNINFVAGCIRRSIGQSFSGAGFGELVPYSYQTSVGVQRQLGETMSIEADYVYGGRRRVRVVNYNVNLTYDPATGVNYRFSDISRRPFPDWGQVIMNEYGGWSNDHALETSFSRRFRDGFQLQGTYTLAGSWDGTPAPVSGFDVVAFALAEDLGEQYGLAVGDQRHRAVFNGIWDMGYGFQLSGLYFFGSGQRFETNYGGDRRNRGSTTGPQGARLRPDGTVVPRNNLVGQPIHRVDLRFQKRFSLAGSLAIDGMLEVFNLFNHENYGSYTTVESNRRYGQPSFNPNVAYQPRMVQLGFRVAF